MKKCTKCYIEKLLDEFAKDKYSVDGLTYQCKQCRNIRTNEYYTKYPEKRKQLNDRQKENRKKFYNSERGIESSRKAHLKRMYGISLEEYNELSERQNHKCAICNEKEIYYRNKVLCVDHCHTTGKIRGLLCNTCNRVLGMFKENKEILLNAIKYLEKD